MNAIKIIAIALIAAGTFGLAYGGFSYTKETQAIKLGTLEMSFKEKQRVDIPMWASIGAIVVGAGLLLAGKKN